VLNWYDGPSRSNATALVSIFIVDAGMSGVPAFSENSVSPRVSDIAMIPKRPLRIRPAIEVISDINDATVFGAVDETAGAAGCFAEDLFDFFDFAAAARLRAADVVVFFFVLVCEGSGAAAIEARRTTANMRSFRYSIEFG